MKSIRQGFTLIELMVSIAVVSIIFLFENSLHS
ncbi:prepilin-type N-terminal cleavage/methylation domain-containing protein [Microbulbifer aggregans]